MKDHDNTRRLLILGIAAGPLAAQAFDFSFGHSVKGSGHVVEHKQDLPAFDAIELRDGIAVTLVQNQTPGLTLQTDDNVVPLFEARVRGRTLVLTRRESTRPTRWSLSVNVWKIESLHLGGGTSVQCDMLVAKQLELALSGGANAYFGALTAEGLTMRLAGGASLQAAGKANQLEAAVAGGGVLDARALQVRRVSVQISGGGSAKVWALDNLDGHVAGGGALRYRGEPRVSVSKSSGGSIGTL